MFDAFFGGRLRLERKRLDKKQAEIAELCGVRRNMWGRYERDGVVPNGDVLRLFALAGGDVQYVLTGERLDLTATPEEKALIALYRSAPPVLRTAAISVLGGASQTVHGGRVAIGSVGGDVSNVGNTIRGDSVTYNAPVESVHIGPKITRNNND